MSNLDFYARVGEAFKCHTINQLVDANRELTDRCQSVTNIQLAHSHNDVIYADGSIEKGQLGDEYETQTVPSFVLLNVQMNNCRDFRVPELRMFEVIVGGVELISVKESERFTVWIKDTEKRLVNLIIGGAEKQIILTFEMVDWPYHMWNRFRCGVLCVGKDAANYGLALKDHHSFFKAFIHHNSPYREYKVRVVNVSFRLRSIRVLLQNLTRHGKIDWDYEYALLRDYRSYSFDRAIAKMIGCPLPTAAMIL